MLSFVNGRDESWSDETILPYCLQFRSSNDSIISILTYLSMANICWLDTAVTNTASRIIWLSVLRGMNHRTINNHKHSHGSIRWLAERVISPEHSETSETVIIANKINGSTLLGLDISSLRSIIFSHCKIGDEEVFLIAHGCPNLTEITLTACCGITDASMRPLGRCCRRLYQHFWM